MREKITVLILTALMILGLSVSTSLAGGSVMYLGKTTWTAQVTDDNKPEKIGVSSPLLVGSAKLATNSIYSRGTSLPALMDLLSCPDRDS